MFFLLLVVCSVLIYFYVTKNHDYWAKRNVKYDSPIPLFGNHFRNQFGLRNITQATVELYNKYPDEKVIGYYRGTTPELIVKDPDLIRHILNVDFTYFYARGIGRDHEVEPLMYNTFHLEGDLWKLLRQRLTPAFSTSKLKKMFPLVVKCAEKLQGLAESVIARGGECDIKELMARYTIEFIGDCGFGIEMDTINNEHSLFIELGNKISSPSLRHSFLLGLWELFPSLRKHIYVSNKAVEENIVEIVTKIREHRNLQPSGRNDFIDMLLELEAMGKIQGESIEKTKEDGTPEQVETEIDAKFMAAQVFVFFAAGFETSSSATSFTLHQLAFHPEIQNKIQEEIDQVLSKYNDKLCYDAITEMRFLEMTFKESMRIFPIVGTLNRVCTKQYKIPGLDITIDPGVKVLIPSQAIHMDEKFYDSPKEFKPERFSAMEMKKRHKYVYLPFGEGQRMCMGARMGHMQSLAGLAAILQKFSVEPSKFTRKELRVSPYLNLVQGVVGGIPLKLKLRKTKAV